ncbi:IDEAL domain-containing protein [Gracilibacillus sp. YIM 98692]|uniref:IDEAL domain-containing protein n=1 Tax=Gracilibacillus sp. YIM 98692 TaxID=2663532 RepID=UPI0013D6569F|nr:IDEAL domain-containing protein [Gracilibacillus sp. YIM 98692]
MLSIKLFKPYYVKEEGEYIRVVLAYQYFSLLMDDEVYQFVPLEGREIRIHRETQEIENKDAVFVFQKGKRYNRIVLSDLMKIKEFQQHLNTILSPYTVMQQSQEKEHQINDVIIELERHNLLRLIDRALDEQNKEDFYFYTSILNKM